MFFAQNVTTIITTLLGAVATTVPDPRSYRAEVSWDAHKAGQAWAWYWRAMTRRREYFMSPRAWADSMPHDRPLVGNPRDGYVLGICTQGVLVPTHFAPRTLRGGHRLLEELAERDTVLSITDDLVGMAERAGFTKVPSVMLAALGGETVEKTVMYSTLSALKGAASGVDDDRSGFDQLWLTEYDAFLEGAVGELTLEEYGQVRDWLEAVLVDPEALDRVEERVHFARLLESGTYYSTDRAPTWWPQAWDELDELDDEPYDDAPRRAPMRFR